MSLLLDVVNDKEDLVVFPRFVGNIGLNTNSGKMSLKMSSWKGLGLGFLMVPPCGFLLLRFCGDCVFTTEEHWCDFCLMQTPAPCKVKLNLLSFVDPHSLTQ